MKNNKFLNIYEEEKKMNNELRNRERKLRRNADKKGLRIMKQNYQIDNQKYSGYLIMKKYTGFVVAGYNYPWKNLVSIEEAERFVAEYY